MGATKRIAEIILQAHASVSSTTNFSMVRFGNILGSSVQLFLCLEANEYGGPGLQLHILPYQDIL